MGEEEAGEGLEEEDKKEISESPGGNKNKDLQTMEITKQKTIQEFLAIIRNKLLHKETSRQGEEDGTEGLIKTVEIPKRYGKSALIIAPDGQILINSTKT